MKKRGGGGPGKGGSTGYVHVHTHNPRARESDERKIELLRGLEVKKLQGYVDKRMAEMRNYIPPDKRKRAKPGMYCSKTCSSRIVTVPSSTNYTMMR
jgi:hypothetical protein